LQAKEEKEEGGDVSLYKRGGTKKKKQNKQKGDPYPMGKKKRALPSVPLPVSRMRLKKRNGVLLRMPDWRGEKKKKKGT